MDSPRCAIIKKTKEEKRNETKMGSKEYSRLSHDSSQRDSVDDEIPFLQHHITPSRRDDRLHGPLLWLLLGILLLSNGTWTYLSLSRRSQPAEDDKRSTRLKSLHWNTAYSSENKTATNVLWKDLFPCECGVFRSAGCSAKGTRGREGEKGKENGCRY